MHEVFPVAAGIAIGALTLRLAPAGLRAVLLISLSIVAGVLASAISGELALSWGFILIDIPQVLVAAVLTHGLIAAWQRRSSPAR